MSKAHRICDCLDCIEIEKEKYQKAKKEVESAIDNIYKLHQEIIKLLSDHEVKSNE